MVALGSVDTANDGTVVFTASTGTLTDKHLEDLEIGKLARVAGKGKASDAEKFDLERLPGTSRTVRDVLADAKLIPQAAAELKRLEPVVEALRKSDPKQGAAAKKLFDEARDSFSRGSFVACNTNITSLRRRLPGGPDYTPLVVKQGPAGAPLAPDYKARKTALEANIKMLRDTHAALKKRLSAG